MTEQEQIEHAKSTLSDWLKEETHWESPYLTFEDVKVIEKALEKISDKECSKCRDKGKCAIYDNFNIDYCSDWSMKYDK